VEIFEVSTARDLSDYWDVYCAWRKTERKTIHANGDFDKAAEVHRLRTTHRRFLARYKGKAIAATTVRFYPKGLIEYSANCSIDEFNRFRPNDLLIWRTIQWACDQGFSRYSLGAAHPFLRKCGGVVVPIYRYRLDRTFLHQAETLISPNLEGRAPSLTASACIPLIMPPAAQKHTLSVIDTSGCVESSLQILADHAIAGLPEALMRRRTRTQGRALQTFLYGNGSRSLPYLGY
jgi:hypothetical protein